MPEYQQKTTIGAVETHPKEQSPRKYTIDLSRKYIALDAFACQAREGQSLRLLRIDLNYRNHTNPDGRKIGPRHVHVYTPGYELKIAYDLDVANDVAILSRWFGIAPEDFASIRDLKTGYAVFAKICNIENPTNAQITLFN